MDSVFVYKLELFLVSLCEAGQILIFLWLLTGLAILFLGVLFATFSSQDKKEIANNKKEKVEKVEK